MAQAIRDVPAEVVVRLRAGWAPRALPVEASSPMERRAHIDRIYRRAGVAAAEVMFTVDSPLEAARVIDMVTACLEESERMPSAIPALSITLVAEAYRHVLSERLVTEVAAWALSTSSAHAVEPLAVPSPLHRQSRTGRWMPFDRSESPVAVWWAHRGFAITCEAPDALHYDQLGRLHAEKGPAVAWANGDSVYAWHGTLVPRELVEGESMVSRIYAERNLEVRRCAIEIMTWPRFLETSRLARIGDPVPDPANPGCELTLHYLWPGLIGFSAHILLCTNASPERDGTRRRYAIFTPDSIRDPLEAAAWSFGLAKHQYAQLSAAS